MGIIVISVQQPFTQSDAAEFWYCFGSCMVWSCVVGEILGALAKAWLLWMANPKNFQGSDIFWPSVAKKILEGFPCMLPTEL